MEENKQNQKKKRKAKDIIAKFVYVFAKFSWFFGIVIAVIALLILYRFVIQPQYQKVLNRQEEVRQLHLDDEQKSLQEHLVNLKQFITLADAITKEEIHSLNALLRDAPDLLILKIQFEKFLEQYATFDASIILGDPVFFHATSNTTVPEERRERIIDLSAFFEEETTEVVDDSKEGVKPEILLGEIPLTISVTLEDYYMAKDFIRDIEQLIPLIDFNSLDLTISPPAEIQDVESEITEDQESSTPGPGATTLTLTGVVQIATIK